MFALGTLKYQKRSVLEVAFARFFYDDHYYHFRLGYGFGMVIILNYFVIDP